VMRPARVLLLLAAMLLASVVPPAVALGGHGGRCCCGERSKCHCPMELSAKKGHGGSRVSARCGLCRSSPRPVPGPSAERSLDPGVLLDVALDPSQADCGRAGETAVERHAVLLPPPDPPPPRVAFAS
jgi:hypothetical protein